VANSGIVGFDESLPGEDPNYGWNRASLQYRSRKSYKPALSTDDLIMPSGFGSLQMLKLCVGMALMVTLLYVWIPVIVLNVFIPLGGRTYAVIIGGAVIAITLSLYLLGARETKRDRELAARL
jgi:hypothetical protein